MKIVFLNIPALRFFDPDSTAFMRKSNTEQELQWRNLETIPDFLEQAVIAAEDNKFYEHHGVDFEALKKAWNFNSKKKRYARGGSTITMQLARNLYLSPHKNFLRKGVEIALALWMDLITPKDRLLEIYLNVIEFGDKIYGAENAAQHYFKKPLQNLNQRELAFLVAIIPSPKKWGKWPPGNYVQQRMTLIARRVGGGSKKDLPPLPEPEVEEEAEESLPAPAEEPVLPGTVAPEEEIPETLPEAPAEINSAPAAQEEPEQEPEELPEKAEFKTIDSED